MAAGINRDAVEGLEAFAGQRVEGRDLLDFVAEQLDAHRRAVFIRRDDFDDIAARAERAAMQVHVVALVLNIGQPPQNMLSVNHLPALGGKGHVRVGARIAEAVNAGDAGDNNHVAPLKQGARGGMAQAVNIFVDGGIFFNVGVGRRDVGFRLVIIVITDEIFDGVVRKKFLEFAV